MRKSFFQEVLSRRPILFKAMLAFNSPREEWPETAIRGDVLAARLWAHSPRSRSFLLSMLPPQEGFWDFDEESRRLALLPPSKLNATVRLFAVGLHSRDIAHTVLRADVIALRRILGEELYSYALHHGQYQTGDAAKIFAGRDRDLSLYERIALHGRQSLAACMYRWPESLSARMAPLLRAPSDGPSGGYSGESFESGMSTTGLDFVISNPAAQRTIWFGLKKTLLKEVDPSWAPCFD